MRGPFLFPQSLGLNIPLNLACGLFQMSWNYTLLYIILKDLLIFYTFSSQDNLNVSEH